MQQSIPVQMKLSFRLILPFLTLVMLLLVLYTYLSSIKSAPLPLAVQMEKAIGISAPSEVYQEAITFAAKKLAAELDIGLENYDLSQEEYEAIVEVAANKFGNCHQYRLYALAPRSYSCFTCASRPMVMLEKGQTFKIGQTCGSQQTRYGNDLPEPGLFYLIEFKGNIFDVLVAEYVKLLMFQYSKERQDILKNNNLPALEMPLPPGNKILR